MTKNIGAGKLELSVVLVLTLDVDSILKPSLWTYTHPLNPFIYPPKFCGKLLTEVFYFLYDRYVINFKER